MTMLIPIRDRNPYRRFPVVTVALIAVNVWVFLRFPPSGTNVLRYGAVPCDVLGRCQDFSTRLDRLFQRRSPYMSLLTSMFMHGSVLHLAGNMLYLWVFGNNVEDRMGAVRYTAFYFVCGLAAAASHLAVASGSAVPVVGASGAISGVLGAYFVLYPKAPVVSLVPIFLFWAVELPAWIVLGWWFVFQLLEGVAGLGAKQGGGVAFFAHVGGFVTGLALVRVFTPRRRRIEPSRQYYSEQW